MSKNIVSRKYLVDKNIECIVIMNLVLFLCVKLCVFCYFVCFELVKIYKCGRLFEVMGYMY